MAGPGDNVGWLAQIAKFSMVPEEYQWIIRMISWFFITLGLAMLLPIFCLFLYDLILWLWRLVRATIGSMRMSQHAFTEATKASMKPTTKNTTSTSEFHVKRPPGKERVD